MPKKTDTNNNVKRTKKSTKTQKPRGKEIEGNLSVHAKGFGFVLVKKGTDIFIPLEHMLNAMDGDYVSVEIVKKST